MVRLKDGKWLQTNLKAPLRMVNYLKGVECSGVPLIALMFEI
jgi:hypothetical protein